MQNKKNLFFFYAECKVTSAFCQRYEKTSAEQKELVLFLCRVQSLRRLSGVTYALKFVHAQFLELMEEWYGHNGPYDDERLEMTRLFEERIGADELAPKEIGCGYCIHEAVCEQRKHRTIPTRQLARVCGNFVHYATLTNDNNNI